MRWSVAESSNLKRLRLKYWIPEWLEMEVPDKEEVLC